MGRRRNRKRERRAMQSHGGVAYAGDYLFDPGAALGPGAEPWPGGDEPWPLLGRDEPARGLVCGDCREFIEDREGGRGTCLHPGSGILSPWTDTVGCDFHSFRRR